MGWIAKTETKQLESNLPLLEDDRPLLPQPQRPLTYTRPKLRHTWKEGDSIVAVALKYGADPEEILDLNLVEEHELKPGDELKIPSKHVVKRSKKIRYEALERPVEMHVNKPDGIQKYAFGNIKSADQITGSGHFPHGTTITIHGIAHVPVEEGEYLAYYMDNHAFGSFKDNGKIAWNIGYAWSELTEGKFVPVEEPEPEAPIPTILDEPDEPITMFDEEEVEPEPEAAPVEPPEEEGDKTAQPDGVLMPLNPDYTPVKFLFESKITLKELHDRATPIRRKRLDPVWIVGTFRHEGEEFYQPGKSIGEVIESGLLWPIPMDKVVPEAEVYDYSDKRRPMTRQEKWFELLMKAVSNYTKFVERNKQKR